MALFSALALWLVSALPGQAQNVSARERQLTKRVGEYFQSLVTGDWRKVENYITKDSQDTWLAMAKSRIESFEIKEVQIAPGNREADVTVLVTFYIPQVSAPFHQPRKTKWIYERRNWFTRLPPMMSATELFQKVFASGGAAGSFPSLPQTVQSPLRFEQNPVRLPLQEGTADVAVQTVQVPFQNVSSTTVTVMNLGTNCSCLEVAVDKQILQPNEAGVLTVTYRGAPGARPARPPAVQATIGPTLFLLDLPVEISGP
ncbi:MAG: DUF1573 domain-containing protein [Terriglobia bacterium]